MTELTVDEFREFFREMHSERTPFPWQEDLCAYVLEHGKWPGAIDAPTGMGKTSTIDVAVFTLAARPDTRLPRRIFFCIDRRTVVDEAHRHACHLARQLRQPRGPETERVAEALRTLTEGAGLRPLEVTRMRGGVTWEARWLDRVDQPAVVVGTVDQLGSRLFFRGYGVTRTARPLDAALVGTDSLFLLDEAHLAQPFLTTLADAHRFDDSTLSTARPQVVTLSATQQLAGDSEVLELDLARHLEDETATERLLAAKTLTVAFT